MIRRPHTSEFQEHQSIDWLRQIGEKILDSARRLSSHVWHVWGFIFIPYGTATVAVFALAAMVASGTEEGSSLRAAIATTAITGALLYLILRPWVLSNWRKSALLNQESRPNIDTPHAVGGTPPPTGITGFGKRGVGKLSEEARSEMIRKPEQAELEERRVITALRRSATSQSEAVSDWHRWSSPQGQLILAFYLLMFGGLAVATEGLWFAVAAGLAFFGGLVVIRLIKFAFRFLLNLRTHGEGKAE